MGEVDGGKCTGWPDLRVLSSPPGYVSFIHLALHTPPEPVTPATDHSPELTVSCTLLLTLKSPVKLWDVWKPRFLHI